MEIGNKILELRKQKNYSQEELAFKMGVARQTISKWELGETSPDLSQSKMLSQIFNVSLDELTNNEIKNILIDKVDTSERLIKKIINILKIILLVVMIIIIILLFMVFCKDYFDVQPVETMQSIECTLDGREYSYYVWQNNETSYIIDKIVTEDVNLNVDPKEYINFEEVFQAIKQSVSFVVEVVVEKLIYNCISIYVTGIYAFCMGL